MKGFDFVFLTGLLILMFYAKQVTSQQPDYYETYTQKMKDFAENSKTSQRSEEALEILNNMTLHVLPQTHIDLAWWWRYDPHTVDVVVTHTLETAFENMEKFPDYTFTFLQVPSIAPLEESYPGLFYKMRYYVHNKLAIGERLPNPGPSGSDGRLAIGSGTYCEFDGSLPCGESLVRQCVYGKRFFKHQFGIDVKNAWFQDAWTHPWTLPQILKKSGMDAYMYTRPRPEEKFMIVPDNLKDEYLATYTNTQDDKIFWWESPDGSRVLAYRPLRIGGEYLPDEENINQYLLDLNSNYGVVDGFTLIGVGNHGGGAIKTDVERMRQVMQKKEKGEALAEIKFSTPERFLSEIMDKPNDFPVIREELFPTIRGIYTTVSEIKTGNRHSENLLMTLEKFSSIASGLTAYPYPVAWLKTAWENVLLNQFHDTISGTDITPSIDDALKRYEKIKVEGEEELRMALQSITAEINTEGEGTPVVVFNPLSWERNDVVEAELQSDNEIRNIQILNNEKTPIPVQIIGRYEKEHTQFVKILFIATVPSMGYATYWVKHSKSATSDNRLKTDMYSLENEFYQIKVDTVTGLLKSVFDRKAEREVLSRTEGGNLIQILEDYGDAEGFMMSPKGFGEYYLWSGETLNIENVSDIRLVESGPVRATLQIKKEQGLARFIQRIHLYAGIRRIDFELVMDWQGKNKMVKVAFPLNVKSDSATYEIPYGTIRRPSVGEEHVAQKWVDISNGEYGVSLLNDSRYGHDITGNTFRLSVLRSPDHPVWATDEKGIHQVRYALYPHKGDWREAQTVRRGYEFNYPLIAVNATGRKGRLPATHSFFCLNQENLNLTVVKKAEDSDDVVLRIVETNGKRCSGEIAVSPYLKFDAVHKTDLLENELESISHDGQVIKINSGKYSIESYKMINDRY